MQRRLPTQRHVQKADVADMHGFAVMGMCNDDCGNRGMCVNTEAYVC